MKKEYAFYECPTSADPERSFVLSGHRLPLENTGLYPFGFGVRLSLDKRSQNLIGVDTITLEETDMIIDELSVELPVELPEITTDGRWLKFTPYLTIVDLKRMNAADLLVIAEYAERAQKNREFKSHWEKISEWVAELRGQELPPVGSQLSLFEVPA